jgi:hypothetical protein
VKITAGHIAECGHCRRELAGVAVIFPGKPAVCGRADCLGWARTLLVEVPGDAHGHGRVGATLPGLEHGRAAAAA